MFLGFSNGAFPVGNGCGWLQVGNHLDINQAELGDLQSGGHEGDLPFVRILGEQICFFWWKENLV